MLRVLQALQTAVAVVAFMPAVFLGGAAQAQSPLSGYQTQQEKEIYNTVPGNRDSGSPIEATNPMDLMNRLRQATSMNDATDPADAIDAALKGYATENPAVGPSMRP